MKEPNREEALEEIREAVESGRVSLAEASGFTADEMDGAYACAAHLVVAWRFDEALHISSLLAFLDAFEGRYYLLAGTALRGLGRLEDAEKTYQFAATLLPDSGRVHIYLGEMKTRLGSVDEGLKCLEEGIALGAENSADTELLQYAEMLLKRFERS